MFPIQETVNLVIKTMYRFAHLSSLHFSNASKSVNVSRILLYVSAPSTKMSSVIVRLPGYQHLTRRSDYSFRSIYRYFDITLLDHDQIQYTFSDSNTDGSFTTAVSNSFLSPFEKTHSCRPRIIKGDFPFLY